MKSSQDFFFFFGGVLGGASIPYLKGNCGFQCLCHEVKKMFVPAVAKIVYRAVLNALVDHCERDLYRKLLANTL